MNNNTINSFLRSNSNILLDGAIGTELYNKGFFINECYEHLNLNHL